MKFISAYVFMLLITFSALATQEQRWEIVDDLDGSYSKRSSLAFVRNKKERGLQLVGTDKYFDLYDIPPDGDCAVSGLCITREEAVKILTENLDDPIVFEKVREKFQDNLKNVPASLMTDEWREIVEFKDKNESSLTQEQLHTKGPILIEDDEEDDLEASAAIVKKKALFCSQKENMKAFICYFYGEKCEWFDYIEDKGTAQLTSCLNALAHRLKCNLLIYKRAQQAKIVRRVHTYKAQDARETIHLLHVAYGDDDAALKNHFERMIPSQKVNEKTKNVSNMFDLLRVLEKRKRESAI